MTPDIQEKSLDTRFFPLIFNAISHGIFTISSDGLITSFNRKAEELTGILFFDYSDVGRLEGHIAIGGRMVQDKISKLKDFPEGLAIKVKHLILSHHGSRESGSPVVPQTLEAFILYYVDELDAKASGVSRIIESESAPDKRWSDWVKLLDRYIYLGE